MQFKEYEHISWELKAGEGEEGEIKIIYYCQRDCIIKYVRWWVPIVIS
jgi:hypothetical protein